MAKSIEFINARNLNTCTVECESADEGRGYAAFQLEEMDKEFVLSLDEARALWDKFFPDGEDVVELVGNPDYGVPFNTFTTLKIKGYDLVWSERATIRVRSPLPDVPARQLIIRIPESGIVRCQERFFGRVLGKKGVKIAELGEKHGGRIRLVPV